MVPQWAPVTLVIVLLMTDPATASRTPAGKVVFGLLAGALMQGIGFLLPDHPDFFYAKVLPIPLCNLAAPACDRIANQAIDRFHGLERALSPSRNLAHIAVWLLLFGVMVSVEKRPQMAPGHPDPHLHAFNQTPLVRFGPDGDVHCRDNPMFCAPFSFAAELRLWRESGWKRAVRSRVVENR